MRSDRIESVGGGGRGGSSGVGRIKIDTNPSKPGGFSKLKKKIKSMDTPANRAKAKVEKRALKAANKPTSKNNRAVGPKTSTYVSDTLKNMKPANPKVTRGGSSKSKLNWPKSK